MKLVVFGATGSVGRHVVEQALDQGHQVTAVARQPAKLAKDHPRLTRCAADVMNKKAVADAIAGQDAVVVTLGAGRKGQVRSEGSRNIVQRYASVLRVGSIVHR